MPDQDERDRQYLAELQRANCAGCVFADDEKVGTGEPCCTRMQGPLFADDGVCEARVKPGDRMIVEF